MCTKAGVRCEHCIAVEISPQERQVGGGVTRGSSHEAHEKGTRVKGRAIELFDTIPEQVLAVSGPDFDALLEALKIGSLAAGVVAEAEEAEDEDIWKKKKKEKKMNLFCFFVFLPVNRAKCWKNILQSQKHQNISKNQNCSWENDRRYP